MCMWPSTRSRSESKALKKYNSERYGSLEVGPSNGALAFDVFAAAIKGVRGDGVGPTPLGT